MTQADRIIQDKTSRGLWERQTWDTPASFRAFHEFYLPQKPPRSVDRAYRDWYIQRHNLPKDDLRTTKRRATKTWRHWYQGKKANGMTIEGAIPWAERVKAWDSHLAALDYALWEERKRQEREAEWEDASSLREQAERMEQFPLAQVERVEEVYEDGRAKSVTIVQPAKWGRGDIARHRDLAAKLARLATGMETDSKKLDITSKGKQIGELTNDERALRMTALLQLAQQRALEEQAGE